MHGNVAEFVEVRYAELEDSYTTMIRASSIFEVKWHEAVQNSFW